MNVLLSHLNSEKNWHQMIIIMHFELCKWLTRNNVVLVVNKKWKFFLKMHVEIFSVIVVRDPLYCIPVLQPATLSYDNSVGISQKTWYFVVTCTCFSVGFLVHRPVQTNWLGRWQILDILLNSHQRKKRGNQRKRRRSQLKTSPRAKRWGIPDLDKITHFTHNNILTLDWI